MSRGVFFMGLVVALLTSGGLALAQGEDSTPGERNLQVMGELLPGTWDNNDQNYFDGRRKLPEERRHGRQRAEIERIDLPAFGDYVFLWTDKQGVGEEQTSRKRIATLAAGPGDDDVTMTFYHEVPDQADLSDLSPEDMEFFKGCEVVFQRRAAHYLGKQNPETCHFEYQGRSYNGAIEIQLSERELWQNRGRIEVATGDHITDTVDGFPTFYIRARDFTCHADIPGVGGGVDIPYKRWSGLKVDDQGKTAWFKSNEETPRDIGILVRTVHWPINNEHGAFTRNSLVLYVMVKDADGEVGEVTYSFTEPTATRLGINMKWMLVACYQVSNRDVKPHLYTAQ